jgi:hypothetical protein
MGEFSARRIVAIAAVTGAVVGGAVAGGVATATTSAGNDGPVGTSTAAGGSLATAAVVRTTLTNTVQVGGSIGYEGSYTVAVPAGTSAQELAQAQQTVTTDQQTLSADEQAQSDATTADDQAVAAAQTNLPTAQATLGSDRVAQTRDCAGNRASTPSCSQDAQKVSQDQSQLIQAGQQLAGAESAATRDRHQNQAKVASDQSKLAADQATLASDQVSAVNPATTYTWVPQVGATISEDQRVYSLSNQPVPLLYGQVAAYRAFYAGMPDGADVGELTYDLIALGYGAGLTQSDHYSSATATAVKRWQAALGLAATAEILLGQVVFEPGPIRVTSVTASIGASLGEGGGGGAGGGGATVLTATGTTPIVTVDLDVTEEYLVKPGDTVSIVLPDGSSTVGGHIESVGNVASCPGGSGTGLGDSGSGSADQSPCTSAGSNSNSPPTVTVTVTLDSTAPGTRLDQAPVNVTITTQTADNVLAVPVNALLALAGGGFGVDVVSGSTSRLFGVTTGIYTNTLVQVSGSGITTGMKVEVPAS